MTSARLPAPAHARYDADQPPWRHPDALRVLSVGRSAVVLAAGPDLVSLTAPGVGLMPGGLTYAADADFTRLRARAIASEAAPAGVSLRGWVVNALAWPAVTLRVTHAAVPAEATTALRVGLQKLPPDGDPGPTSGTARLRAHEVALAAVDGRDELAGLVRGLVGAGPGSTPTGDDVLVGVQAGLRAVGKDDAAHRVARAVRPWLGRTTLTGAHFLRAAQDNRFADHVHTALGAVRTGPPAVPGLLVEARSWGATSGIDLLWGLAAGLGLQTPTPSTA